MNSIKNLSILFSTLIGALLLLALVMRDPLVRKCESVKKELSVIVREDPNRPSLQVCNKMIEEAVYHIEHASQLNAEMRRIINQPVLSYYQSREVKQLRLRSAALRERADSLLEEAREAMHRLPPAL